MKEYMFSASCPPQALKAHVSERVAAMQAGLGSEVRLKLKWRGPLSFQLRAVRSEGSQTAGLDRGEDAPGETVIRKHRSAAGGWMEPIAQQCVTFGVYIEREWSISEPFCGTISPVDGAGSVLRGHFSFWSLSALWIAGFGVLALAAAFWNRSPLLAAAALLLTAWHLYHRWRRKDRCAGDRWLVETLRQIVQTAPPEQESRS